MRVLLTNDDGINSGGLRKLAEVLRARNKYKVTVIAPAEDRSGVSHGITILKNPVRLIKLGEDDYSCSGHPADCVLAGIKGVPWPVLPEKPDLVLSGINRGANLGTDIIYSGTAAAARQAGLFGVPAVALSLSGWEGHNWDMAASWAADHLEELLAYWRKNTFVNVNIPNSPEGPAGIIPAWPAAKEYNDTVSVMDAPDGSRYCFLLAGEESTDYEAGSDCDVVSRNYVSVSTVYNYPAVLKELCPNAPAHAAVAAAKAEAGRKGTGL